MRKLWLALPIALLLFWPALGQSTHSITVGWNASATTGVAYNVYRSTSASGPFTKINSVDVNALTYTDTTGTGGTTYYYQTTAVCDSSTTCPSGISGESAPSPISAGALFLGNPAAQGAAPTVKSN
jgi:fibronectin type 3 domain-containing protein